MSLTAGMASAQNSRKKVSARRATTVVNYLDSLKNAFSKSLEAKATQSTESTEDANVSLSPYLYRLLGQGMYYSSATKNQFDIDWEKADEAACLTDEMSYREELNENVDALLASAYVSSPNHFTHYDSQFVDESIITTSGAKEASKEELSEIFDATDDIKDVTEIVDDVNVELKVTKPNFWKKSGKFALQFTQNYFTHNWYKGGNNNGTMLSTLYLSANYNDQKMIQWDNSLDLRLGFVTASSDTCHTFLTNNDKINLNSKLGIKASKSHWYYTVSMQAFTQFMPGYRANRKETFSKFLAPLDVSASIGMDFKPQLKKDGWSLSLALLPLSYKLRYIGSDDDNNTIHSTYNMKNDEGEWITTKHDFGSRLEYVHTFKLLSSLSWKCRLYYYTTYKYAEAEMENAFSYSFNKYLTAEFFTLWRFDDNRNPKDKDRDLGYFQFREYLTFGLAYSF